MFGRDASVPHHFSTPSQAFHSEHCDSATRGFRHDLGFKTAESGVEAVQRHLHSVEGKIVLQHFQVNLRIFVPGKSDEANFALLLRIEQCLGSAIGSKNQIGIILVNDFVDLPKI